MKVPLPKGKNLILSVQPIKEILPHEDVISSLLSSIKQDMKRTGSQRDPIVIDGRTKVALDGMHRRAALASLGAKFAICAEVDYMSRPVILERWLRYFIAPDRKFIHELISVLDLSKKSKSLKQAIKEVDGSTSGIAVISSGESYSGSTSKGTLESYRSLSNFDELAKSRKVEVQFHPEDERVSLFTSKSVFVLYPPKLKKREIVSLAMQGKVLPFKTTRHIIPARPMGLYFPLKILMQPDIEWCNRALEEYVNESRIELLERFAWYEGRKYSEPLAIFRRV